MKKPKYNEEDVNALEHVSMLIDEYMCCDDDNLTEYGKNLKELVEDFYLQWEKRIEKYIFEEDEKRKSEEIDEEHKKLKNIIK